jgi:hypothetical protein
VNAPIFPDGDVRAANRPYSNRAAWLAVDAQWRAEFRLSRVTPHVINITSARFTYEVD